MSYDIDVPSLQAILMAVATEGTSLHDAVNAAKTGGDDTAGQFGTATEVAEAFTSFWTPRADVGQRISSLVFRKAETVAVATQAFLAGDDEMHYNAHSIMTRVDTGYVPPLFRPQPLTPLD